jgi:hypothetical protein
MVLMNAETPEHSTLSGLDEIDWAALEHAYGPAEDIPHILRALATGSAEEAEEALYELWGNIWHQGSVYPATVPAVPYLARIAASGRSAAPPTGVLQLLGSIAKSSDPRGVEDPDAVHEAVAACYDLIVPLLKAPEDATRAAAMFVLAHSAPAERVQPLFVERWRTETDPMLRAEVLHALLRLDTVVAAELADEVFSADDKQDDLLLLSAAVARIRCGGALDERVLAAASAPAAGESVLSHWYQHHDLFNLVVDDVAERHGTQAATSLVVRALNDALGGPPDIAELRLAAARSLIVAYRSAAASLVEPIARFLDDPKLAVTVINLLTLIGPAAAPAARDRVVSLALSAHALVLDDPDADSIGPDSADIADYALVCLVKWADPIVPKLLVRVLADRPEAFPEMAERDALPFDAELLTAIRRRITEVIDEADDAAANTAGDEMGGEGFASLFRSARRNDEPIHLANVLSAWGADAAPAAPELTRLLATSPIPAARALAAIRPQAPETVSALRTVAADLAQVPRQQGNVTARIVVAQAIRALGHDSAPLLEAVLYGLSTEYVAAAAEAAADLPGHADVLVPRMIEALAAIPASTPSLPAHHGRIDLGYALWRFTGAPDHLVSVLRDALDLAGESLTGWTVAAAADKAAELGPLARDLRPAIEAALEDARARPSAARALLAIDPEGAWATTRREELVEHLISSLTDRHPSPVQNRALDLLTDLVPLPSAAAAKLRGLADRDERILGAYLDPDSVRTDENARTRIRALLERA